MKNLIYFFDSRKYKSQNYCGFNSNNDFRVATSLSVLFSGRLQPLKPFNLILISDSFGKELLVDKLKLDFDKVIVIRSITDNTEYEIYNQEESFICVNFDVITLSEFPVTHYKSQILAQHINYELPNTWNENFVLNFDEFNKSIKFVDETYEEIKSTIVYEKKIKSLNISILGGNDVTLLKKYSDSIIRFKKENNLNSDYDKFLKTIYSYYFFITNDATITPIIPKIDYGKQVQLFNDRFAYIQFSEYSKKNKIIVEALKNLLKNWYPQTYNKLQSL